MSTASDARSSSRTLASGTPSRISTAVSLGPARVSSARAFGPGRLPPATRPGDYLKLRAEMDLVVVGSACPQDISVINGPDKIPRDVPFVVEG